MGRSATSAITTRQTLTGSGLWSVLWLPVLLSASCSDEPSAMSPPPVIECPPLHLERTGETVDAHGYWSVFTGPGPGSPTPQAAVAASWPHAGPPATWEEVEIMETPRDALRATAGSATSDLTALVLPDRGGTAHLYGEGREIVRFDVTENSDGTFVVSGGARC